MRVKFKDETIQSEVSAWTDKLTTAEAELQEIPRRREALTAQRDANLLAARTADDVEAQAAVEEARAGLIALDHEESELALLIGQIKPKIAGLEAQRQAGERQTLIDQLINEQEPQRFELMNQVETKTAELMELLVAADKLGASMEQTGDRVYGYDGAAETILRVETVLGNFLHGQLGRVFQNYFHQSWGQDYKNLAETDKKQVRGFLERALKRQVKGEKKW